jgi:hypothetical protein
MSQRGVRDRKGAKPQEGRQSRERQAASAARKDPGAPPGSGNVGSTSGRKGKRGSNREAGSKAVEENALEGRNPRRARFGSCRLRTAARRSPSRLESSSGVAAIGSSDRMEKRQERRGPERGTADREEQGPEGRTPRALRRSTGRRQARRRASRREGTQTLRAEGVGAWNPRVDRILLAGMCCRGRNPMSAVPLSCGTREGAEGPDTPESGQAHVRRSRAR